MAGEVEVWSMNRIVLEDMEAIYQCGLVNWERLHGKSVLVSGAYGMLASYMVYFLIFLNERHAADIQIFALGRDPSRFDSRFGEYTQKDYFHIIVQDVSSVLSAIPQINFIIHAASHASPHFYGTRPVDVMLPNAMGTWNLLEKARTDRSEGLLFISSGEAQGIIEGKDVVVEDDMGYINPMDIRSCYGESKRMGEALCKGYSHQYGVPAKVVRPGHTYGPTADLNDSRVFSCFVADAVAGRNIHMKSDGSAVRTFCYISDATLAFFKVLLDAPAGEVFNVMDSGNAMSIVALAELVASLSKRQGTQVVRVGRVTDDAYMKATEPARQPICSAAKLEALGWKSTVGVQEGFRRTIESFQA